MKIRNKIILAGFLAIALLGGAVVFVSIGNSASWREEILLHDGRKLVVTRTADRGGRHEIGQRPPIESQSLSFRLPSSNKTVRWEVEYAKDIGYVDLSPIMLDIIDSTPYLVSRTVGCLAYNKWGRPNPPYIIFRYIDKTWQQIDLKDLPLALKIPNMIISSPDVTAERTGMKVVSAEKIHELNSSLSQPELITILRVPLNSNQIACTEMIPTTNGGWVGIEGFIHQTSYERCLWYCKVSHVDPEQCPCDRLFNKNNKER